MWTYPFDGTLPDQFDCLALNVRGSAVWTCSYTSYRLVSVNGDVITDHGAAPQHGASGLLIDAEGRRGALLGGYGPDYDVVVPFWITRDGLVEAGNADEWSCPTDWSSVDRAGHAGRALLA